MLRYLTPVLVIVMLLSSCGKEEAPPLTRKQIQAHIDSATAARVQELERRARIELEHRMKIEVKVKADSIARARELRDQATTSPATDTSHKK